MCMEVLWPYIHCKHMYISSTVLDIPSVDFINNPTSLQDVVCLCNAIQGHWAHQCDICCEWSSGIQWKYCESFLWTVVGSKFTPLQFAWAIWVQKLNWDIAKNMETRICLPSTIIGKQISYKTLFGVHLTMYPNYDYVTTLCITAHHGFLHVYENCEIYYKLIVNKYKKQLNKLKKQVGMVGPKSKQTRIWASWQDASHLISSNRVSMKMCVGIHLVS